MDSYSREYYQDIDYKPELFYVIFGVSGSGELEVSRERHRVDEFPEGLELQLLDREKDGAYMDELVGGTIGQVLQRNHAAAYGRCAETEQWAVIRGQVQRDDTLDYLRNVIGFVQAFVDQGAVGVMDVMTISLMSAEEWTGKIFEPEFNPWKHVTILISEEADGSRWLHTRGMRKFGRPDISFHGIGVDKVDDVAAVVNQMIYYGARGAFFGRDVKLHTQSGKAFVVRPEFVEDFENFDFNNAYYEAEVLGEETE